MKTYRRQRQQYLFASLLGLAGIVNVLFFFILYQPARSDYIRLKDSIQRMGGEVQSRKIRIEQLEKLSKQLAGSEQDRQQLFTTHFIPRNAGWSEILPQLNSMVERAGVKNTRKDYAIADAPQFGLYSVKIRVPVSGAYPNVVNFIKDIENSDTFFIINSIDVRGSNLPAGLGASDITLALNLETFFYQ